MPHVIEPFKNTTFDDALRDLREAHTFVVQSAAAAIRESDVDATRWGITLKRTQVDLADDNRPKLIGKPSEKLGEVINIAATVERLIAAIEWFAAHEPTWKIDECHPSTSDESDGNDLVIVDANGTIAARCEVCDVVSLNASSNGKEKKDIGNLGCTTDVPEDNVRRYICTAPEFANALTSEKRKWATKPYRYDRIATGDSAESQLLLIRPNSK